MSAPGKKCAEANECAWWNLVTNECACGKNYESFKCACGKIIHAFERDALGNGEMCVECQWKSVGGIKRRQDS